MKLKTLHMLLYLFLCAAAAGAAETKSSYDPKSV
jgi:hypothetical protein